MKTPTISKILFTLIITLLFALPAHAGTFDKLNFIGFSQDGKHMAFETYGISDGSGHGYAKITFIDVAKNAWAGRPVKTGTEAEMYTEAQARTKNRAKAAKQLAALNIVDGATGTHAFSRKVTDLTTYSAPVRFARHVSSTYQIGDFELHLNEIPVSSAECAMHTPPARNIFALSLKNRETNRTQILQQDTKLPQSRYCPESYRIADVFLNEKRLVVFLNMFSPGFEGHAMSYLAVTGIIE